MRTKLLFIGMILSSVMMFGQDKNKILSDSNSQDLSRLTVGLGVGGSYLFEDVKDYYLTTDGTNSLKMDNMNRKNFVLSQIVIFRLGVEKTLRNEKYKQDRKLYMKNDKNDKPYDTLVPFEKLKWNQVSVLLSLNLLDLQTNDVGFNKNIDGGVGLSYALTNNLQIGVLYEFKHFRQLRPYIVENYLDQAIPNGETENYTTLDQSNNNLFYDKTIAGVSLKFIFNIATF